MHSLYLEVLNMHTSDAGGDNRVYCIRIIEQFVIQYLQFRLYSNTLQLYSMTETVYMCIAIQIK